jgi:cellulose synthase/poly-beta-1,6-N-acetylglucosamine synthase-like glycosyltransferase
MTEGLPFVSVVVPARNCERTIGDCLASILRGDYPPDRREVLVVDNASTDRTAELVGRHPVRALQELRRGAAAARNRGIAESRGEMVAFLDADGVATTRWLRELVRSLHEDDAAGVAGEIVSYPPESRAERYQASQRVFLQRSSIDRRRPFAVTANVAFRREVFDRIGLFDPWLRTAEDQDFSWRLFAAGLKLTYSERALVFTHHRPTDWGLFKQHVGWGYGAALLHRKYGLPWSLGRELGKQGELLRAVWELARADGRDVHDRYYEVLRRSALRIGGLYGILEGLVAPPPPNARARR